MTAFFSANRPRVANLTDDEMRYLVEILGAMPNATVVSSDVLNVNMMPREANCRQEVTATIVAT